MSLGRQASTPDGELPKLTWVEVLPVLPPKTSVFASGLLWPGLVTALVACFLFFANQSTGLYLKVVSFYLIYIIVITFYLISGSRKRLFSLFYAAILTVILLSVPRLFDVFVAVFKDMPGIHLPAVNNFLSKFHYYFVVAGLMEELIKAVPALSGLALGLIIASPRNLFTRFLDRISVRRPIDGVLMGIAAGGSFTLYETLTKYNLDPAAIKARALLIESSAIAQVGKVDVATAKAFLQISQFAAQKAGISDAFFQVVPRVLFAIAGHVSYAAVFGYFIGLAALRRSKIALLLAVGWLFSATLHASWDASTNGLILLLIAMTSFLAFLIYFLKARALSQVG